VQSFVCVVVWRKRSSSGEVSKFMGRQLEEISGKRECQSIHSSVSSHLKSFTKVSQFVGFQRSFKLKHRTQNEFQDEKLPLDFLCLIVIKRGKKGGIWFQESPTW
jgi:hypothetical protein